jgi:hypothetical protein
MSSMQLVQHLAEIILVIPLVWFGLRSLTEHRCSASGS